MEPCPETEGCISIVVVLELVISSTMRSCGRPMPAPVFIQKLWDTRAHVRQAMPSKRSDCTFLVLFTGGLIILRHNIDR